MCVLCVHSNDRRHSQYNQDIDVVQMKYREPKKNSGGGEIFSTRPDRSWGPTSLLHNGYRLSFPGVKRPGRSVNHPPPFSADVKEK